MNTQTVTLDVTKRRQVMPEIRIGQGDKDGTTLVANIYDNGEPFTLTNYSVRFAMKLPFDMAYYAVDGTVSGNTATFAIDESYAASVAGVTETAYVEVLSGSTVICSTNRIRVVCLESAYENVDPAHIWDNGVEQFLSDAQDAVDAAVDDADAATTRATQAAEAAEGAIINVIPTMSETIKGGAKLGSGLEIDNESLNVALVKSGTGRSVTSDGGALESLAVHGESVQDGTPTPDAPVEVQVVEGRNLCSAVEQGAYSNTNGTPIQSGSYVRTNKIDVSEAFTVTGEIRTNMNALYWAKDGTFIGVSGVIAGTSATFNPPENASTVAVNFWKESLTPEQLGNTQLEKGSTATPYTPYGSIGLQIGDTVTPIDLQGNVLASLPDGTKDVLAVDSAGHCVLDKRVGVVDLGTLSWGSATTGTYKRFYSTSLVGSIVPPVDANVIANCISPNFAAASFNDVYNTRSDGIVGITNQASGARGNVNIVDDRYSTAADFKAGVSGVPFYYQLATPATIDLGYIDMPAIPDGSTISITAQVTPTIAASWWARGAAAIAEALKAVRARIDALQAAIAELATA